MKYTTSLYNYSRLLNDGRTLIWNTYTGSLFILESNEFTQLSNFEGEFFEKNKGLFLKAGVLQEKSEKYKQQKAILKHRKETAESLNEICYRILPTTACNAKCPYCYEKDIETITMDQVHADAIINYITKASAKYKAINIFWFGGEPLLCKNTISYITEKIIANNSSKYFYFDMTTNGILFDRETVIKAKNEWHISEVQISLDGTEENYTKIKNYVSIKKPFERILNNIGFLVEFDIHVVIRLNVNKDNVNDLIKLIDILHTRFGNKIEVYAYPIFPTTKYNTNIIDDSEIVNCIGDIYFALKKAGYLDKIIRFPNSITWACSSTLPNNYVIMPNGYLLKCSSEIGQNCYVGDVYSGISNTERANKWSTYQLEDKCKKCCFLPVCQGGCRASIFCKSYTRKCCLEYYLLDGLIDRFFLEEL